MPDIQKVEDFSFEGRDGFLVTWEMIGFDKRGAEFRAKLSTAMRFPTTVTEVRVLGTSEFGDRDYNVDVWVPTEGFGSAGIKNPVEWVRENFGDRFRQ